MTTERDNYINAYLSYTDEELGKMPEKEIKEAKECFDKFTDENRIRLDKFLKKKEDENLAEANEFLKRFYKYHGWLQVPEIKKTDLKNRSKDNELKDKNNNEEEVHWNIFTFCGSKISANWIIVILLFIIALKL